MILQDRLWEHAAGMTRDTARNRISDHVALVRYCSSQWRYTAFEDGRPVPRQR